MHLSASDIAALAVQHKVHFLNERAIRDNRSLGDAAGLRSLGIHLITVQPGDASTELHVHRCEEEAIYVLSGRGTATVGDDVVAIGPGDFIGCPAGGAPHDMHAEGDAPLVCLVIGQRLEHDVVDYPRLGKRLYRNSGEWNLVEHSAIARIAR